MVLLASSFIACKDKPTVAVYEGKDISGEFSFEREKMTKTAMFQIKTPGKWELFVGQSVEGIDFSNPFLEGEGEGVYMLNLPDTVRSYFQLKTPGGKAIFAERHLPMTGGYNFRDLGGYRTQEGRYIKWGKLIRSDELHHLTKKDLKYLSGVPIQTIVDFRSESERNTDPDKRPSSVGQVYELSIMPGTVYFF